ncbi:hypothetical protein BDC45DRAFT_582707, partial [Circinella umbellata]
RWRRFWTEPILPQVRNLWHRALHQSLSCKVNLHVILPHFHPSDVCSVCNNNSLDTLLHFLYTCPIKWNIWCFLWSELFLFFTPTTDDVHSAIFLALVATLLFLVFFMESGVLIGPSFFDTVPSTGIVSVITFIACYLNRTHYLLTNRHNPFHHTISTKKKKKKNFNNTVF